MTVIPTLLVVDGHRDEFREAIAWLHQRTALITTPDIQAAAGRLAEGRAVPQLIVLAQAYPGQYHGSDIDTLRQLAPLARIAALSGSWCEGELRSGAPWPGVQRIFWHRWCAQMSMELKRLEEGRCPLWGLPQTSNDDEQLLRQSSEPSPQRSGLVAIFGATREATDALSECCRAAGYATVSAKPGTSVCVQGAAAAIYDAGGPLVAQLSTVKLLVAQLKPAPVILLANFPRTLDRKRVLAAGARGIVAKPFLVDELLWLVNRVAHATRLDAAREPAA